MSEIHTCEFNPDKICGNMYFRGIWEFCPEYDPGDVVLWNGLLYMALKHQAGNDPSKKESKEYWQLLGARSCDKGHYGIEDVDGGYASTDDPDVFDEDDLVHVLDGGSASERQFIPLTD